MIQDEMVDMRAIVGFLALLFGLAVWADLSRCRLVYHRHKGVELIQEAECAPLFALPATEMGSRLGIAIQLLGNYVIASPPRP